MQIFSRLQFPQTLSMLNTLFPVQQKAGKNSFTLDFVLLHPYNSFCLVGFSELWRNSFKGDSNAIPMRIFLKSNAIPMQIFLKSSTEYIYILKTFLTSVVGMPP